MDKTKQKQMKWK